MKRLVKSPHNRGPNSKTVAGQKPSALDRAREVLITRPLECTYMRRSTRFGLQPRTGSVPSDSCLDLFYFFYSPVCFCGYPQRVPDAVQSAVHVYFLSFLSEQLDQSQLLITQHKFGSLAVTLTSTWRPPLSFPDLPTMHRVDV